MKKLILAASLVLGASAFAAHADEPPQWMAGVFPERALDAAWQDYRATYADQDAALSAKTKQLIALAVAAQIPCDYCTFGHTQAATGAGATDEEIKEAIAVAAQVRKLSTMLNGYRYDMEKFQAELGGQSAGN
jgi:AhpD family alkylhydroperoxidase